MKPHPHQLSPLIHNLKGLRLPTISHGSALDSGIGSLHPHRTLPSRSISPSHDGDCGCGAGYLLFILFDSEWRLLLLLLLIIVFATSD
jgi:hypothetical protein